MAPPAGSEGDVRGARLSPDRKIAKIRKRSQHRITRWRRQLQDRIRTERRDRKQKIKAIKAAQIDGLSDPEGTGFVTHFEGVRLVAYQDSVGVWTIGVGHTGDVDPGDTISMKEAMRLLQEDARIAYAAVEQGVDVKVGQEQVDSCISIAFNIGNHGFLTSTLLARINARASRELIHDAFLMWVYAGGQKLEGLVRRREAEARLFNHGRYT